MRYDLIIIGGGVIGSAIARECTRYRHPDGRPFRVAVLEKEADVVCETSGRNSGVLHAGFNNRPGSLMARFCVEGNRRFDSLAAELDVPFRRTGKLVVGFSDDDRTALEQLLENGKKNGCPGLRIINRAEIRSLAPSIEGEWALYAPTTGILNPFLYTIALAENAVANGADYYLKHELTAVCPTAEGYRLEAGGKTWFADWVVNAAGLYSDRVARLFGIDDYTIYPCRGEYYVLDKKAGSSLPLPVYPVPNVRSGGLGIHLTPTVDGNILIGPSTEYLGDRADYAVTRTVMDLLAEDGGRMIPSLGREFFIRNFSGLRPKLAAEHEGGYRDFVVEMRPEAKRFVNIVGIESPGLTSAQPIAKYALDLIKSQATLEAREDFNPLHRFGPVFHELSPAEQEKRIAEDADYGEVICRCEQITRAEVLRAIRNPLGARTVSAVKVRCRAMTGRCQGGYCQTRIVNLLRETLGLPLSAIELGRRDAWMFTGKVREEG